MDIKPLKLKLLIAIFEAEDDGHLFNEHDFEVMIECVRRELIRMEQS